MMTNKRAGLRVGAALLLVAAVLAATPVAAQEQTAESAQKFLTIIAGQQPMSLAIDAGRGYNVVEGQAQQCRNVSVQGFFGNSSERQCNNAYPINVQYPDLAVMKIETVDRCTTVITTSPPQNMNYGQFGSASQSREAYPDYRMGPPLRLEFAKLSRVEQQGAVIYLKTSTGNWRLATSSSDMATRVAYALEFLRQQCDAAAGTGF